MKYENVPVAVAQIGENALNKNNRPEIRYNYIQTLMTVRDYCHKIISEYEKTEVAFSRKPKIKR